MAKTAIPDASRGSVFLVDPDNIVIIGVDTDDGPEHELYQEGLKRPLDQAMVASVIEHGVLEAISVRKNGSFVEAVTGRHRTLWARAANEKLASAGGEPRLVPCIVKRLDTKTAGLQMVVENEHRKQPDDPIVRARHAQRMITNGHDTKSAARAFNVSPQAISQRLKLLDLAAPVQKMLEAGQLSASAASTLAPLEHKVQVERAKELVAAGGGVAEAQRVVRAERAPKTNGAAPVEGATVAPNKVLLRKVVAHENFKTMLDADTQNAIRWAAGEGPASRIAGLTALIKAVTS